MAKITLNVDGFDELLAAVKRAQGNVEKAADECVKRSARVLEGNLKSEAEASGADASEVKTDIKHDALKLRAEVGWKLGTYDSDNPSQGYRAMFVEYGTGKFSDRGKGKDRETKAGANRGSTLPHPFMNNARKKSEKPIHAIQEDMLKNIAKEFEG